MDGDNTKTIVYQVCKTHNVVAHGAGNPQEAEVGDQLSIKHSTDYQKDGQGHK